MVSRAQSTIWARISRKIFWHIVEFSPPRFILEVRRRRNEHGRLAGQ
jgi:hypothetical protein